VGYEALEDLEIFQTAEQMCDRLHKMVSTWPPFDRETVGSQLVRAADSVGANMAESYGRFHYGDKLNFLYFARGSLYETKFWVRRARTRQLWTIETTDKALEFLDNLAKKLNTYIRDKRERRNLPPSISEASVDYEVASFDPFDDETN
jgi:four helix bundle protein